MERNMEQQLQAAAPDNLDAKSTWTKPVMTKLQVEDAESGANTSEGGGLGS